MQNIRYIFVKAGINEYVRIDLSDFSEIVLRGMSDYADECMLIQSVGDSYASYTNSIYEILKEGDYLFLLSVDMKNLECAIYKRGIFNSAYTVKSVTYKGIITRQTMSIHEVSNERLMLCLYCNCSNNLYGNVDMVKRFCLDLSDSVFKELLADKNWRDVSILLDKEK